MKRALAAAIVAAAYAAPSAPAAPIPYDPASATPPAFEGSAAKARRLDSPEPPRHPHMAPNGRSNIHNDAFQTDAYRGAGPLGRGTAVNSILEVADCASVTFDSRGRIVTICVGVQGPRLEVKDPRTLEDLSSMTLPPRNPGGGQHLHGLLGRRLLLSRQPRPGDLPDQLAARLRGGGPAGRVAGSRSATTTSRRPCRRGTRSCPPCRTSRGESGSSRPPAWWAASTRRAARCARAPSGRRSRTRSRSTSEGAVYVVTIRRSTASRRVGRLAAHGLARALPQLGDRQARPVPRGLGHHADGDVREADRDHRQRGSHERRGVSRRQARRRPAADLRAACLPQGGQRHRSVADRGRQLADRGEQLRLCGTDRGDARRLHQPPASSAWT